MTDYEVWALAPDTWDAFAAMVERRTRRSSTFCPTTG